MKTNEICIIPGAFNAKETRYIVKRYRLEKGLKKQGELIIYWI